MTYLLDVGNKLNQRALVAVSVDVPLEVLDVIEVGGCRDSERDNRLSIKIAKVFVVYLLLLPSSKTKSLVPVSMATFSNFLIRVSNWPSILAVVSFRVINWSRELTLNWVLSTYIQRWNQTQMLA